MENFLSEIHKQLGRVAGEIAIAISVRKVYGGRLTLKKWADILKDVARQIEEKNVDPN